MPSYNARGGAALALGAGLRNIGRVVAEQQDRAAEEARRQEVLKLANVRYAAEQRARQQATDLTTWGLVNELGGGRGPVPMLPGTPGSPGSPGSAGTFRSITPESEVGALDSEIVVGPGLEPVAPVAPVAPTPAMPNPRFMRMPGTGDQEYYIPTYENQPDQLSAAAAARERQRLSARQAGLDADTRLTAAAQRANIASQIADRTADQARRDRAARADGTTPPAPNTAAGRADAARQFAAVQTQIRERRADPIRGDELQPEIDSLRTVGDSLSSVMQRRPFVRPAPIAEPDIAPVSQKTPGIGGWISRRLPGGESGYVEPTTAPQATAPVPVPSVSTPAAVARPSIRAPAARGFDLLAAPDNLPSVVDPIAQQRADWDALPGSTEEKTRRVGPRP